MTMQEPAPVASRTPVALGAVALWVVLLAGLVLVGADLLWVVSLGDAIRATGEVPAQVPNLVAPQDDWRNPVVLAELLLSVVASLGGPALAALHLLLVALTLLVLVGDGRRAGGTDRRLAIAVSLVVIGAAATLAIIRFPSLSLLPFVALVALLRAADRSGGRIIWWVPPLMVLWGNLHGAVLVGLAVLGVFVLAAGREGIVRRMVVGLLGLLCLVLTSAGLRTPEYYVSALGNEAATRGTDLWARPSPSHPLDIALVLTALVLLVMASRSMRVWEWLVVAGLVVATATAARHGVWLLLFLAPVAGVPAGRRLRQRPPGRRWTRKAVAVGVVAMVVVSLAVGAQLARRPDAVAPPGRDLVPAVAELAAGGTVLAVEPAAETFAQRGVRVWVANPIDAFDQPTQVAFLDFLHDCTVPEVALAVVVVEPRCVDRVVSQGWSEAFADDRLVVLERR